MLLACEGKTGMAGFLVRNANYCTDSDRQALIPVVLSISKKPHLACPTVLSAYIHLPQVIWTFRITRNGLANPVIITLCISQPPMVRRGRSKIIETRMLYAELGLSTRERCPPALAR